MAWDDTKTANDDFLSADWNNMVTDQKTRAKILTPEETTGASCTLTDGDTNRVFIMSNTTTTVQIIVYVEGRVIKPSQLTITHAGSGTTVEFLGRIFDTDEIIIYPYG